MRPDYFLLDRLTKRKFHKLSFTKVIHMLSVLPDEELCHWFFWQKGMEKWRPVKNDPVIMSGVEACQNPEAVDQELPNGIEPPEVDNSSTEVTSLSAMDENSLEAPTGSNESSLKKDIDNNESNRPLNLAKDIEPNRFEMTRTLNMDLSLQSIDSNPPPYLPKKQKLPLPTQSGYDSQLEVNRMESSKSSYDPIEAKTELIPTDPLARENTMSIKTKIVDSTDPLPENFDPANFKKVNLEQPKDEDPLSKLMQTTTVPPEFITQSENSIKTPTGETADDRRRTKRFDLNFRLMISNGEDSIISFSSNISLGGILLAHELPLSFVGTSCEVYVMNNETRESIQLACLVLGTVTDRKRIAFDEKDIHSLEKLLNWMGQGKLLKTKKVG